MSDTGTADELRSLTGKIVSAYVSKNAVAAGELPQLISQVYHSISMVNQSVIPGETKKPAVPIKNSIRPDYIVCLEDGKKLKMLKRHLMTDYKLTPDAYRLRWGLKKDYPMVAPNYARQRSKLAKAIGLGKKGTKSK